MVFDTITYENLMAVLICVSFSSTNCPGIRCGLLDKGIVLTAVTVLQNAVMVGKILSVDCS